LTGPFACADIFSFKKQEEADCIRKKGDLPGYELYAKLDEYFQHLCQGILLASPEHESELVTYVVSTFQRYTERAFIVQRMTSYVNQHYVRRAFNEELGWLNVEDALIAYANHTGNNLAGGSDQRTIAQIKGDFVVSELKKWGYKDGDSKANAAAEARAEAASPLDRIVPISSLAHRRFRTEFLEALLLYDDSIRPKSKLKSLTAHSLNQPKGRLAQAVQNLLVSSPIPGLRPILIVLDSTLSSTGVRPETHLRKWLRRLLSVTESA